MYGIRIVSLAAILCIATTAHALAPSDTRQRQAAAEAYDQGTAAYLSQDFEKAAQWFETANRMSPAAPALIQAARSHQQAGHLDRAATLALRLTLEHQDDPNALQFGEGMLNQLAGKFLRVDVSCDDCKLAVDGTLQESQSFFVEPDANHTVTANFETGDQRGEVTGPAGETRSIEFVAPPPSAADPVIDERTGLPVSGYRDVQDKPLKPLITFIGAGLTAGLLAGSIISTVDTQAGVEPYNDAAAVWRECAVNAPDHDECTEQHDIATKKLDDGQDKEIRTTVLWIATGAVAAGTAVIAVFLTDWSGGEKKSDTAGDHHLRLAATPTPDGAAFWMTGRF